MASPRLTHPCWRYLVAAGLGRGRVCKTVVVPWKKNVACSAPSPNINGKSLLPVQFQLSHGMFFFFVTWACEGWQWTSTYCDYQWTEVSAEVTYETDCPVAETCVCGGIGSARRKHRLVQWSLPFTQHKMNTQHSVRLLFDQSSSDT